MSFNYSGLVDKIHLSINNKKYMITLQQTYDKFLEMAIKRSPKSKKDIAEKLAKIKDEYKKLEEKKKEYFDKERMHNPFGDSRILVGDAKTKLKRVMVGIDISVGEILLANELSKSGKKIDAVIAHHPEGRGLVDLTSVMDVQEDIAVEDGVPVNIAEKLLQKRVGDLNRALHATNHYQVPQAAQLLGMPFACYHTFADNQCHWFLKSFLTKKKLKTLNDVVDALLELPEYQRAAKLGNKPAIFVGSGDSKVGKMSFSGITGGTSGNKDIYEKMAMAGVGTIIAMHMGEEHKKLAEKYNMNVVVASHMASDSLGMNILMDELEKKKVEIVECGGFIRASRAKKRKLF
jgi:putative NIF3 family GTP cyclohydrolase 1 type 2